MIRAITPRPIAWVSTVSDDGIQNLAPFSYFNGVGSRPASLMFAVVNKPDGSPKDTLRNIKANKQFVVNVVPYKLRDAMLSTSRDLDYGESEFAEAGVTPMTSISVRPPRVAESPIQLECELIQIVPVGDDPLSSTVVIGKILLMHVSPEVLNGDGKIDPALVDTIGRMGGRDYVRTSERFSLTPKDGKQ